MKVKDVIKELLKFSPNKHVAVNIWDAEDILHQEEQEGVILSSDEANEVIDQIHKEVPQSIDWDVLGDAITKFNKDRKPPCK